jgi:ribosomal protein L11 methylase PrmA
MTSGIRKMNLREAETEWGDYYANTNYASAAMASKEELVGSLIDRCGSTGDIVHDLGANTGRFSRLAASRGHVTIAHDIDSMAVERHYQFNKLHGIEGVLPLQLDLTNPTPAIGWALTERMSFTQRASGGIVVALALVHHLAISNNVPLGRICDYFAELTDRLIIEFVPKEDSQVQRMLATREDIFDGYHVQGFEDAFGRLFQIVERQPIPDSQRILYLMRRS